MNLIKKTGGNAWVGLLIMLMFMITLGLALLTNSINALTQTKKAAQISTAQASADGGVDRAIARLNQTAGTYGGESDLQIKGATLDIIITSIDATNKYVNVIAYSPSKAAPKTVRKVRARVSIDNNVTDVSFHYGIQSGPLGVTMSNNSSVIGNIYGQGALIAGNNSYVSGDVIMSGANGRIQGLKVWNPTNPAFKEYKAKANTITNSDIYGDAYYQNINSTAVRGTSFPNTPDPSNVGLPLSQQLIDDWEAVASNPGQAEIINGAHTLNGTTGTLGPAKINGDLLVTNNARLTLTGIVWVTGNITISNGAMVKLTPEYGQNSGVIVADNHSTPDLYGKINVSNNAKICGSYSIIDCQNGTAPTGNKSYVMLLSTNTGSTIANPAVNVGNNSSAVVYYTTVGMLEVSNNAKLRAFTGGGIHLSNGAQVTYDTGLASAEFSTGPGGAWRATEWQIVY